MLTVARRLEIAEVARSWLGVPFAHQGRSRAGIDCAGLVYCLAFEVGADASGYTDLPVYGRDPDRTMARVLDSALDRVDMAQRAPGSILFFAFARKAGQHLAIVTERGDTMVHAYEPAGAVVETRMDRRWLEQRLRGVYDYRFLR